MSEENRLESRIAVFMDFENLALGVKEAKYKSFDIGAVLTRILEKGRIIAKRAYADWTRYRDYTGPLHSHAVELIEVPQKHIGGKNSADIRLVVDAMDMCYAKEHVDKFVIVSGDSDFSPLVSKLKENDKLVLGVGVKQSTSDLLVENCDEFIFYEDIVRPPAQTLEPLSGDLSAKQRECFQLVFEAITALSREGKDILWGSMIKQTIKRKKPSFNEGYYGYDTFSELLEDAEDCKLLTLEKDERSGGYVVAQVLAKTSGKRRRRGGRGGRGRSGGGGNGGS
jgi:uncharacterized LabA/DUF88 family protein